MTQVNTYHILYRTTFESTTQPVTKLLYIKSVDLHQPGSGKEIFCEKTIKYVCNSSFYINFFVFFIYVVKLIIRNLI